MTKHTAKLIVGLFLICISTLYAQPNRSVLAGIVLQKDNGKPVANASVFINGTSYGTICSDSGKFQLLQYPKLPITLTITAVGFESKQVSISDKNVADILVINLVPKVQALKEVQVKLPSKDGWEKYGLLFTELFIGYSNFAKQCVITNKGVLDFYHDRETGELWVVANKPLIIKNNATGYIIQYWLEDFSYSYKKKRLFYKGYSKFEEIPTKKKSQINTWKTNRAAAYQGSITHFMRSLYEGNTLEQGFELRLLKRVKSSDAGNLVPLTTDTIDLLQGDSFNAIVTQIAGNADTSVSYVNEVALNIRNWYSDPERSTIDLEQIFPRDTLSKRIFRLEKLKEDRRCIMHYFKFAATEKLEADEGRAITQGGFKPKPTVENKDFKNNFYIIGKDGNRTSLKDSNENIPKEMKEKMGVPVEERDNYIQFLYTKPLPLSSVKQTNTAGEITLSFKDFVLVTFTKEDVEEPYNARMQMQGNAHKRDNNTLTKDQESVISLVQPDPILVSPDGNYFDAYNLLIEGYWDYEKLDKLLPLDYQ